MKEVLRREVLRREVLEALGKYITTNNMDTPKGGKAANQFEVYYENGVVFKSYNSLIAVKFGNHENIPEEFNNKIVIGSDYDYSKTTNKYRCMFLDEYIAETRKKINNGTYLYCSEM